MATTTDNQDSFNEATLDDLLKQVEDIGDDSEVAAALDDGDEEDDFLGDMEAKLLGNDTTSSQTANEETKSEPAAAPPSSSSSTWEAQHPLSNDVMDPNAPSTDDLLEQISSLEDQTAQLTRERDRLRDQLESRAPPPTLLQKLQALEQIVQTLKEEKSMLQTTVHELRDTNTQQAAEIQRLVLQESQQSERSEQPSHNSATNDAVESNGEASDTNVDNDEKPKMITLAEAQHLREQKVISAKQEPPLPGSSAWQHAGQLAKLHDMEAVVENLQAKVMVLVEEKLQLQTQLDSLQHKIASPPKKGGIGWFQKKPETPPANADGATVDPSEDLQTDDETAAKADGMTTPPASPKKSGGGWLFLSGSKKKPSNSDQKPENGTQKDSTKTLSKTSSPISKHDSFTDTGGEPSLREEDDDFTSTPVAEAKKKLSSDTIGPNPWNRMVQFVNSHTNSQVAQIDQLLEEGQLAAVDAPEPLEVDELNSMLPTSTSTDSLPLLDSNTDARTSTTSSSKDAQAQAAVMLMASMNQDPKAQAAFDASINVETVDFGATDNSTEPVKEEETQGGLFPVSPMKESN